MIDPRGMSLTQWADGVILTLNSEWSLSRLDDEIRWMDWAAQFQRIPELTQRNIPNPYQFSDWREWAMRSYSMLENI